jgi:hypothetical protein
VGGVGEQTFRGGGAGGGGTGGGSGAGFAGGGAGTVGGYTGLLQVLQEIRNSEENLRLQVRTQDLLEEFYRAGDIVRGQVDQFSQNLETERANLLNARNNYANQLDVFKGTLGLPPDVEFELDDTMIRRFQFIDPRLTAMEEQLAAFQERLGGMRAEPDLAELQKALAEAVQLGQTVNQLPELVQTDLAAWRDQQAKRQSKLSAEDLQNYLDSLAGARKALTLADGKLAAMREGLAPDTRRQTATDLVRWVRELMQVIQDLSLVHLGRGPPHRPRQPPRLDEQPCGPGRHLAADRVQRQRAEVRPLDHLQRRHPLDE